jgi:hypothetical protein
MILRVLVSAGVLLASSVCLGHAGQSAEDLSAVLDRSSAYVAGLEKQLEAIIWHESYHQIDRVPRRFAASGGRFTRVDSRRLEAEMLFVWVEANAIWMAVRDVISVDGKPVVRRLPELLKNQEVKLRDLQALSDENGRYNIGPIERNFNEPMLALLFLDSRYRSRFKFSDGGSDEIDGTPVMRIAFREVRKPTVIRSVNQDVKASGIMFVEASTGRVLRTSLEVAQPANRIHGRIVVSYGLSSKLGVMVPIEMRESYGFDGTKEDEGITCTATYSDFRQFETAGRLILR